MKPALRRALFTVLIALGLFGVAPGIAAAALTAGDIVFRHQPGLSGSDIDALHANGTRDNLTNDTTGAYNDWPAVSPDGSMIAYTSNGRPDPDPNTTYSEADGIYVMNSDGSGKTLIVPSRQSDSCNDLYQYISWNSTGTKIVYTNWGCDGSLQIWTANADGSGLTNLSNNTTYRDDTPAWSPNGTKIAFSRTAPSVGHPDMYVMNADGTGKTKLWTGAPNYGDTSPSWSPDGTKLYYDSGLSQILKRNSDGTGTATVMDNTSGDSSPQVSGDGTKVVFMNSDLYSMSTTSPYTQTRLTTDGGNQDAVYAWNSYPVSPPSNATVALRAPSVHDAFLKRTIDIKLSNTGIGSWRYGWSTSSTTAPTTFQTSTDVAGKTGVLDFTPTNPDSDWYLWVRSVTTGGTLNAWGTPLKIHTPKEPVWVGVGDSYSSGHHQGVDEPGCPDPSDIVLNNGTWSLCTGGSPHWTKNDPTFSWVGRAATSFNTGKPSAWRIQPVYAALSGATAMGFGDANAGTPGTDAWAVPNTQAARMSLELYSRSNSWNVVSVNGGADDANFAGALASWYIEHPTNIPAPWNISTLFPSTDCPDTNGIYNLAVTNRTAIRAALQGIATLAVSKSPSTHVLSVGYPYVLDSTNSCHADSGSWKGEASVINELNSDAQSIVGTSVKYLNLTPNGTTSPANFGSTPVSSGYIQLTRFYGYPHPSDGPTSGVDKIASGASPLAFGSGW